MDPLRQVCARFRTKAMVDRGETLIRTPEALAFPYCWCTRTLTDLGPDGGLVTLSGCRNEQRPCHQPIGR